VTVFYLDQLGYCHQRAPDQVLSKMGGFQIGGKFRGSIWIGPGEGSRCDRSYLDRPSIWIGGLDPDQSSIWIIMGFIWIMAFIQINLGGR